MELDPGVWSKLPQELLEYVFARLPTKGIARIRTLSKTWKLSASTSSAFTRACAKAQPNLYGIMCFHSPKDSSFEMMYGRVYDTESCKWLNALNWALNGAAGYWSDSSFASMACDGGLVCLASASHMDIEVLPLIVGNPLTREWRQLPVHHLVIQYSFLQLKVNPETRTYGIGIVGYVGGSLDSKVVAEFYSSSTNEWSRLESGFILGVDGCKPEAQPQVYDCSTGEVRDSIPPHTHGTVLRYKAHLNDLYVLERLPFSGDDELIEFSQLNVSKYEDGNWSGANTNGFHQGATPPVNFEIVLEDVFGPPSLFVSGTLLVVLRNRFQRVDVMMFYGGEWHEFEWKLGMCHYEKWKHPFCGELRWDACP